MLNYEKDLVDLLSSADISIGLFFIIDTDKYGIKYFVLYNIIIYYYNYGI